ncbi:basic 7S globulin-like [Neltuma alba]|uniref:basic 7S globulin-like n=1 Tax=Neltuma alba TaxID=207710 RepID=UPI0010A2D265|nr:basic 7S globulin-like [Prosopis alba]
MASSSALIHFFLLSMATFSISCSSLPHQPKSQPYSFKLPIKKDPLTNLYYASVGIGTPQHNVDLVVDLGGPSLWYDCNSRYNSSSYRPVSCQSKKCPQDAGCTGCSGPFKPGCSNDTCGHNILNSLAKYIFSGDLGDDVFHMPNLKVPHFLSGCTASDSFTGDAVVLEGLPKGSDGIIGLARTELTLPAQLSSAYKLPRRFSLCLPSSTNKGYGDMLVGAQDVSKVLKTIPLIVNPVSTAPVFTTGDASYEYFIDVKSIKIDGKAVNIKPSLLSIDKKGNGGTKITTMSPFTELHSSVYKPFLRQFVKQAASRKMKRVSPVPPFEACYDSSSINRSGVPSIDLELQGGVTWTIHETNLMVTTKHNVVCLGFVDGGKEPKKSSVKTSIVIGGHQLEDNLLVFDLVSSKLSFSSSLLLQNTSCSRF